MMLAPAYSSMTAIVAEVPDPALSVQGSMAKDPDSGSD
jgi:hypothetical protein